MPQAVAQVKGGFWAQYGVTMTSITTNGRGAARRLIAQALGKKGNLALRETMETLNGAAPGAVAAKTYSRIQASEELGGKRVVETETLINRATTATDKNDINADVLSLTSRTHDPTPVPNLDGNPLGTR